MTRQPANPASKATHCVAYRFRFENGSERSYTLQLHPDTMEQLEHPSGSPPAWTELGFRQCPDCPLDASRNMYCPLATSLVNVVDLCKDLTSYDAVHVVVESPDREVRSDTSVQRAISSLLGLIIATSACPHTTYLRPMARFHLPLATVEETVYRATSMYLLAQYFIHRNGDAPDLDLEGLQSMYKRMQTVNMALAERLRAASDKDGAVNAVVLLDLLAKALPSVIEDALGEIRYIFAPYLGTA